MSEAGDRVNAALTDAQSSDDMVSGGIQPFPMEPDRESPLDRETLDEQATTHMGERWEPTRRDAN